MNGGGIPFEQLPANFDPLAELNKMTTQQMANLEQQSALAEQQATAESQNRLQTLQQEFNIEWTSLQNEWRLLQGQPASDAILRRAEALREAGRTLNKKYELAATRISGKDRPDLQAIQQAKQNATMKIQQDAANKQIRIDQIRRMVAGGAIDPYEGKSEELKLLGITVSASQLRPKSPTQQIADIDRDIKLLDAGAFGLEGGQRSSKLSLQEQIAIRRDMLTRRDQLVQQLGGEYAGPLRTATRMQRVAAGQMAGTQVAQGIAEQKPKKKPLTREAVERHKKAGLTKEQAREALISEGYEVD